MTDTSDGKGSGSQDRADPDIAESEESRGSYRGRRPDVRVIRSFSPGPNDWNPGIDSEHLYVSFRRGSSSGVSSLVHDNGDAQQLADHARERDEVVFAPIELSHAGSRFEDDERSIRSRISLTESELNVPVQPQGSILTETNKTSLKNQIFGARVESLHKEKDFLPLDSLDRIITVPNIERELRNYNLDPEEHDFADIAKQVLAMKTRGRRRGGALTKRRKIFAVLVMINKSDAIVDVIQENLYDDDLPFEFEKTGKQVFGKRRDGVEPIHVQFFARWEIQERQYFNTYQWEVMAPYFELSWEPGEKVYHYTLAPRDILPFLDEPLEIVESTSTADELDFSGGTSTVRKVKIHKAHYNFHSRPANSVGDANPYFAVKTLKINAQLAKARGRELEREALAMKRFVDVKDKDKAHHHLIRLLATFSHKDQFSMILPCADGNLEYFWKKHSDCDNPPRNPALAKWVARQCLGLARAVQQIHLSHVDGTNVQGLDPHYRSKEHGRHGDIKPENILFFSSPEEEDENEEHPMGVLKISDFGFADFHRSTSLNVISKTSIGGMTPTYRAPEYDVTKEVSPAYDIWSFGCVLLQFVVWYVDGWAGIEAFATERVNDSTSTIKGDDFFNFYESRSAAKTKPSVSREIDRLRTYHGCPDFLLDLLDFIDTNMLKLKPQCRATCAAIVEKLEAIYSNCKENKKYCTERVRNVQHTPTDQSEFVRYSQPPKDRVDPINVVDATSIVGVSPSPSPRFPPQGYSRMPSEAPLPPQASETTPLINGSSMTRPTSHESDRATSSSTTSSRRGIARFFGCFGNCFGKRRQP